MLNSLKVPAQHFNHVDFLTFTGQLQHLNSFLFQRFCCTFRCCEWDHCFVAWPNLSQALAFRHMALHLTLEYLDIKSSWWWTLRLQSVQVLRLQNKPKSLALHHYVWQLIWGLVLICCVCFSPNMVLCIMIKTSPLWSCLSKEYCSRSFVICSDATLET